MFDRIPPGYKILGMFFLSQLLGSYTGVLLFDYSSVISEFNDFAVTPVAERGSMANSLFFLGYVIFAAILMYFGFKLYKGVRLLRILEGMMIVFSSAIVITIVLSVWGVPFDTSSLIGMLFGLLLAIGKLKLQVFRNLAVMFAVAGVGSIFGFSLGFLPSLVFAIGLSVYDYIAVFKTKHMVTLAERVSKDDLAFTIAAGEKPKGVVLEKMKDLPFEEQVKHINRAELGSGDMVVPIMLSVSSYSVFGVIGVVLTIVFGTIGLYLLMRYNLKRKSVLPALPPIVGSILVGYLIFYLLSFY